MLTLLGANVENASYGHNFHFELTIRRHNLRRANSNRKGGGTSSHVFEADWDRLKDTQSLLQLALPRTIHVHAEANFSDVSPSTAPCGICRQVYIPARMV